MADFEDFLDLETNRDGGVGNTKTPTPPQQCSQLKHWFFTFNNYDGHRDIEILINTFNELCYMYAFQEEKGEEGTAHLQGIISLHKRARWSEFGLSKSIHWEKPRDIKDCYKYCTKQETRSGEVYVKNFNLPYIVTIPKLYAWQEEILEIIKKPADCRSIYWYWEPIGNIGKTTFGKYLFTNLPNVVVLSGKGHDMKNGIVQYHKKNGQLPKTVIINCPKDSVEYISYTGLEEIKDMFFFSGKFEGGMICGPSPHLIVFANKEPITRKMSMDRWKIRQIEILEEK